VDYGGEAPLTFGVWRDFQLLNSLLVDLVGESRDNAGDLARMLLLSMRQESVVLGLSEETCKIEDAILGAIGSSRSVGSKGPESARLSINVGPVGCTKMIANDYVDRVKSALLAGSGGKG
jgi:hypothetical protein